MGREIVLFESEEKQSRQNVVAFLRELADKVEQSRVVLQKGGESLTLEIPANLTLEIKAEEEDKKGRTQRSLEVELEWYEGEEEGTLSLG